MKNKGDFFSHGKGNIIINGRDEKGCLLSTEKNTAVDVDRHCTLIVEKCKMVHIDIDHQKSAACIFLPGRLM